MYGRASTLYPRSLEMLDQLDLLDEINQLGFVARNSVTFDKTASASLPEDGIQYSKRHMGLFRTIYSIFD
jgi:2-polyprenyl-6-methoxyphenol hydroxylase-like FAD-dependent oxidoreductase